MKQSARTDKASVIQPNDAIRDVPGGTLLRVHAQPRAAETACAGLHGGAVKIRVAAPPSEGAANEALCRFLSERCGVPIRSVQLMAGAGGRHKRVMIRGATAAEVRQRLLEP